MIKRTTLVLSLLVALVAIVSWMPEADAVSGYFSGAPGNCTDCHAATPTTCKGCHAHGTHASVAGSGINITGRTNTTSYSAGQTVQVTISGGVNTGWVRAILYDQNMVELARSTGTATGGMGGGASTPVTLSAPAPTAGGTYTWNVAWYGHEYDGATPSYGARWTPDPNNPNHGQEIVATNSFTVVAANPCAGFTPSACTATGQQGRCANGLTACNATTGAITCTPGTSAAETCNNIDDNCDGQVDNITSAACTVTGQRGPCANGRTACVSGAQVCQQTIQPVTETCNNVDDNCDGTVDNIAAAACNTGRPGICAAGTTACSAGAPVCNQTSPAGVETFPTNCADTLDNDCDGLADAADPGCAVAAEANCFDGIDNNGANGIDCADPSCAGATGGTATTCGVGACQRTGNQICQNGQRVANCTPGTPTAEVCDNIDNNCDGTVDNGIAAVPTTCGTGICAATGQSTCVGGRLVNSCTPGTARTEVCNNLDDDCNGVIDNIAATPTTCGVGACASTGQQTCQNGNVVNTCTPRPAGTEGPVTSATCGDGIDNDCDGLTDATDSGCVQVCTPTAEVCDGVDNDCDGTVDDGIAPTAITCGTGACQVAGQRVCLNGRLQDQCTPLAPGVEGPTGNASCADSIDNDCDGLTDATDPNCTPVGVPQTEVCNGKDDDFNGHIDDIAIAAEPTTCGVGACANTGALACQNGQMVDTCAPRPAGTESFGVANTCNDNIDNDCDGLVDAADNGCTAPPVEQACFDGIDNDGDGRVDCRDHDCEGEVDGTCDTGLAGPCAVGQMRCDGDDDGEARCAQTVFPRSEICYDGIDNDCDGQIDAADSNCQGPQVDLDIYRFTTPSTVNICAGSTARVTPRLEIVNNGRVSGSATATLVGVRNGSRVYNRTITASVQRDSRASFSFPSYTPTRTGNISWTVTIADQNADADSASRTTSVTCSSRSSDD